MSFGGASAFVPEVPVGIRSTHGAIHHDGRPDNAWIREVPAAWQEISDLRENNLDPRLTVAESAVFAAILHTLMLRARQGTISVTGGEGSPIRNTIFELKPEPEPANEPFGRTPPHLRLYLGEPAHRPRALLALKLAVKARGLSGLGEQDAHIDEALDRAETWAGRPAEVPEAVLRLLLPQGEET